MVPIIKKIVPSSKYDIKCPFEMKPTRIVVHNTANDASARNEIAYMTNNDYETSFHYAVDGVEIVQGIEEDRNAWHAGDGNGVGNREGIGIEICYSLSGGERFDKAEDNAVDLIVDIMNRYGFSIEQVTKHQDYSGKYCPHRTLDNGWERFINKIQNRLNVKEYELLVSVPVYMNAKDAIGGDSVVGYYDSGIYYIFNEADGMINITKNKGIPGAWINPNDNKIVEEDKKDEDFKDDTKDEDNKIDDNVKDEEDKKDDYYDKVEKNNPLLYILELIFNFIKKLFKR